MRIWGPWKGPRLFTRAARITGTLGELRADRRPLIGKKVGRHGSRRCRDRGSPVVRRKDECASAPSSAGMTPVAAHAGRSS